MENELKERLSELPLYVLKSRSKKGDLTIAESVVIKALINEKENDKSVNTDISQSFMNGERLENVSLSLNDSVKVINGFEKDKYGSVICLVSLIPEPIYLIELDGKDGDRELPQSSLRIAS